MLRKSPLCAWLFTLVGATYLAGAATWTWAQGTAGANGVRRATPTLPASLQSAPLQTFTAQDRTASLGIPAGWHIVEARGGQIATEGPRGELVAVGNALQVRNGPYQIDSIANFSVPFQAPLPQKGIALTILGALHGYKPSNLPPTITIVAQGPIQAGSQFSQCGHFLYNSVTPGRPNTSGELVLCSTPLNSNGYYKLISLLATLPASLVNQERGTVEAMLSSYRVPPVVVQNYLLAFYPAGAATTAQGAPGSAQLQSNPTVNAEMSAAYLGAVEHQIATKQRAMSFGVSCQDKVINGNYLGFDLQGC